MNRRFTARTCAVFAALVLASCLGDSTGPNETRPGLISIAPDFNVRGIHSVDVNRVLIRFTKPNSTVVVYDTIVAFPAASDTLHLDIHVPINGPSQQLLMTILMIDDAPGRADTVFQAGPTLITATAGAPPPTPTPVTFTYVGTGAKAAGVRFLTTPTQVLFGDTVVFTAEAFDSNNVTIPNTPIIWSSSDTTRAKIPQDSIGRVIGGIARGPVTITAALLTPPSATRPLLIQPKPASVLVQGGSGQTGGVGSPLAQPVAVRVNAADNLGVQGVIVNFAVVTGGGTLSQLVDTTDVNGDASAIWTLGATLGAQSVSATVPGVTGGSVTVPATGVVGTAKKLAFLVQPTNVAAAAAIAPPVRVTAQDTFGNTVANFTGNITVAIGANPGAATLGGTTTVAAVAGIATFSNLTLNNLGTGYTLAASATGLTGATSTAFNVAGGVPAQLVIVQQPSNTTGGSAITPAITVQVRDALNNLVPTATNTVTVAIGTNPKAGALSGTQSVAAVGGVATFSTLGIDSAGTGYTLIFSSAGLTAAISASFDITAGPATVLGFTTQPPASAIFQSPFATVVTARDGGGNVATSFTGAVSLGIGVNPASGTLFGPTTVNAVAGVATFSGVSVDNIGAGYTLTANASGLAGTASSGLAVVAPANANAWINPAGGNWSTASNWSKGTVPNTTDTIFIRQSGTYTVNLDLNSGALARLDVGAPLGLQTLSIASNMLTMAGNGAFTAQGRLALSGTGIVAGAGTLDLFGALDWQGGSFSGGGGTTRVNAGGSLAVTGSGLGRSLSSYTLELAASGTWNPTTTAINTSTSGILRVLAGGQLDLTGDFGITYIGGALSRVVVLGTLRRTTSANPIQLAVQLDDSGSVDVQTGTLQLSGGGTSSGAYAVATGAVLDFTGGTHTLAAGAAVSGAGTVRTSGATLNASGTWSVTGTTQVTLGAANFNGATMATAALSVSGGTLGGGIGGLLTVSGAMSWSGGSLNGFGGTTRVLNTGSLAVSGSGSGRALTFYTLESAAPGTWSTTTAAITTSTAGFLRILAGGQLDLTGDFGLSYIGGAVSRVVVLGTLRRITSANPILLAVQLDDSGSVDVQTGTLQLSGSGISNGSFTVAAGTTLDFTGGNHTLQPGSAVSGAGTVRTSGATVQASGTWNVTGTTQLTGGTAFFNGATMTTAALNMSGGTLGGNPGGLLTVSGPMAWSGGSLNGAGGTTRVQAGGTLAVSGSGTSRSLATYTLELASPGTWNTTTAAINTSTSGILRVLAGGQLDLTGDFGLTYVGGAVSRVVVLGTLRRTTSANPILLAVQLDDSGSVDVQTGTLQLSGGGTSSGAYAVATGAVLDFTGGTHTLAAGAAVSGAGTVRTSGATVNASGTWNVPGTTQVTLGAANFNGATMTTATLSVSGGTLGGGAGGLLTVSGPMTWSGGNLSGTAGTTRVLNTGSLAVSGSGSGRAFTNYNLESAAPGTWNTTTAAINTSTSGILRVLAGGQLDLTGDFGLTYVGGAVSRVVVLGTLRRTTSANPILLAVQLDDSGSVDVQTGTLQLSGGGTLGGTMAANAPGVLSLAAGTFTMLNNLAFSGTGTAQLNGATLSGLTAGDTVRASVTSFVITSGSLNPAAGATVKVTGNMDWAGNASLAGAGKTLIATGGTLAISGTASRALSTETIEIASSTGNNWTGAATVNASSGATIRVLPTGTFNLQAAGSFANLGGAAPLFENQGVLTVAPGAAATFTTAAAFNNSGTLGVTSGTLALTSGGTQSGPVSLAGGTLLDFNGGIHTLNNGFSATGAGTSRLQSGTITTSTALDTARFQTLQLNSGTLGQPGGVVVSGLLDWAGNTSISGTGMTRLAAGSLTLTGTASRSLASGTLENRGAANWSGAFTMNTSSGAVFRNHALGTFNWTADANMANLGGAVPSFVNEGSLTVNTGSPALAARFGGTFIDTTGSLLSITSGDLMIQGGGRIGGAPSIGAGAFLEGTGGTLSLKGGTNLTGTGNLRINGMTVTVDSGLTAAAVNVELLAGTLTHEGLLTVSNAFTWSAGTISSNAAGQGGTTRILSGATMSINNAAAVSLSGTHILDVVAGGTANYTGANINTSSGSIIQNAGNFNWLGTGSIPFLGGAQSILRNLASGTIQHNNPVTGTTGAAIDNAGLFQLNSGIVQFTGGSSGNFRGSANQGGGADLDLAGGTFTQTGTFSPNGTLLVSSGSLVLAGNALVVGTLNTTGSGALVMSNPLDSINVAGSANFGGGTGTINTGVIRVQGNFTQSGTGASYAPTGTHRLVMGGNVSQAIFFGTTVNSFVRYLEVNKTLSTFTFATNVRATGSVRILSNTTVDGPSARVFVGDSVTSPASGSSFIPLVVEIGRGIRDSGNFSPDTTVFAGSGQVIPFAAFPPYVYKSIRVAQTSGTATFATNLTIPNDLVVSAGPLDIGAGRTINVTGAFRTEGTGQLQMVNATGALVIAGNATFGGSSTAGVLTAGNLTVNGDFTQAGGSLNAFTPTVAHHTTLGGTGTQNISFANPTFSFFDALSIASTATRNVVLQTNVRTNDSLIIAGGGSPTDVIGAGTTQRLTIGGVLRMNVSTASARLAVPIVELAAFPSLDSGFTGTRGFDRPDTTVFLPGITTFPTGSSMRFRHVRVSTGTTLLFSGSGTNDSLAGQLEITAGSFSVQQSTIVQKLITANTGTLTMTTGSQTLTVRDSALFSGGSTVGLLTFGTLVVGGNFVQGGGNGAAFQAAATHTTTFTNVAMRTIQFATPGTGGAQSTFGAMSLASAGATRLTLVTPIFVAGILNDGVAAQADSVVGNGNVITANGFTTNNTVLDNAPLTVNGTLNITATNLRMRNFPTTVTQLTMNRNVGSTATFTTPTFFTTPTTGQILVANQIGTGGAFATTVTGANILAGPGAGTMQGPPVLYTKTGSTPTISWNGTILP